MTSQASFVARLPVFQGLTGPQVAEIIRLFHPMARHAGDEICREGDPGDCMFVLESGEVEVLKETAQGDKQILATLKGPDVVGEMSLLAGTPRSATLRARTEVVMYRVDRADFDQLREQWNPAAYRVIRNLALTLCARIRDTSAKIKHFFDDPDAAMEAMRARQNTLLAQRMAQRQQPPDETQ